MDGLLEWIMSMLNNEGEKRRCWGKDAILARFY